MKTLKVFFGLIAVFFLLTTLSVSAYADPWEEPDDRILVGGSDFYMPTLIDRDSPEMTIKFSVQDKDRNPVPYKNVELVFPRYGNGDDLVETYSTDENGNGSVQAIRWDEEGPGVMYLRLADDHSVFKKIIIHRFHWDNPTPAVIVAMQEEYLSGLSEKGQIEFFVGNVIGTPVVGAKVMIMHYLSKKFHIAITDEYGVAKMGFTTAHFPKSDVFRAYVLDDNEDPVSGLSAEVRLVTNGLTVPSGIPDELRFYENHHEIQGTYTGNDGVEYIILRGTVGEEFWVDFHVLDENKNRVEKALVMSSYPYGTFTFTDVGGWGRIIIPTSLYSGYDLFKLEVDGYPELTLYIKLEYH